MGNRQPRQLEIPIAPQGDANIEQIINQRIRRRRMERPALMGQREERVRPFQGAASRGGNLRM
jgi:hypothetical protein